MSVSLPIAAVPHESKLANGVDVVIVPYASAPVATLMVVYHVGARNEAVGYTGSSHLLEHMLFKGTLANSRANGRAFADIMNEIGASKNATTWIDRTNYFETVPVEFLPLAIELEADRMRGALIADADRQSEMTVVRNELERNDNNSARVLSAALVATAFREHPYHHPTIGWRADVEGVSTERLRELYDTFYHPGNATVFVIGDVDVARTSDLIERYFGALPAAATAIPDVYTTEPPQAGERSVVVKRPGDDTLVAYAYHTPAALGQMTTLSSADVARRVAAREIGVDVYALEVLARIVGRGRTSRLSRALVDERLALDVTAWNWASRDPGLFQILVNVTPGVPPDEVRRRVGSTLAELAQSGPELEEVERVRAQIAVQRAFARDGTFGLAQRLAEFEAAGSWHLDDDYVERIAAVTPDDVRDVLRTYLHEDNRTTGTLVPGVPKTFDVVPFEPVETRPDSRPAVPMPPLVAPPHRAERRFAERIVRAAISPGIESVYVSNPESATVAVRGLFEAGPVYSGAHPLLPGIVGEMLARGTRSHGRIAIEERLERAGIRRAYFVDDDRSHGYNALAFRFAAACAADDLPLLFEILAEELREPAFLAAELDIVKTEIIGALRLARTNTGYRAMERFLQIAYRAGDPNYALDLDAALASVEGIAVADVRAYYETFATVPAIVSAAGPHGPQAFASFAEPLATVPFAARRQARPESAPHQQPARDVREHVEIERKASVDIVMGRATSLVRRDSAYYAASIANGILGQSTLSSRLGLQLRDREGLTYGVTSGFLSPGRLPGPWRIGVTVNPANVERAIESARAVLREYAVSGPTDRELVQQRNSMAGSHRVALATNGGIAAQLERVLYYDLGDDHVDRYRDVLEAVTLDDVRAAIAAYLDERELTIVSAGTLTRA